MKQNKICIYIKEKMNSIQFRLFTVLCISTIIMIFSIVIVNNLVLESFYVYNKINKSKGAYEYINNIFNSEKTLQIDKIHQVELRGDIEIYIEDKTGKEIYAGGKDILNQVDKYKFNKGQFKEIYNKDNIIIKRIDDQSIEKYMLLNAKLDNGYTIYIKMAISPIQESVKISNQTLMLIGFLTVVISACVASIISKKFTKPIVQLNKITKKVSNLDFSEKYRITDADDEINRLGKNINTMSDKLEKTITQLRQYNNDLERDIEEK